MLFESLLVLKKRPNISGKQVVYMYTVPSTNIGNLGKYGIKKICMVYTFYLSLKRKKKHSYLSLK